MKHCIHACSSAHSASLHACLFLTLAHFLHAHRLVDGIWSAWSSPVLVPDPCTFPACAQARERQLERLERMLDSAKGEQLAADERRAEADESARRAAEDAAHARQRAVQ
eukprot:scaffold94203_cov21-Tisochrysis_lutea.AAC.1